MCVCVCVCDDLPQKRARVFSQVDNPNNNSEWSDQSVDCSYVGTFEVGAAQQVDKTEVSALHPTHPYVAVMTYRT